MDNFKEIADKCLDGLLRGTFVLRNGNRLSSCKLHKVKSNGGECKPYALKYTTGTEILLNAKGRQCSDAFQSSCDVVDFLENVDNADNKDSFDVRTLNLSIEEARNWYNEGGQKRDIALYLFKESELLVRPKNWEQYKNVSGFREDKPMSCGVLYPDPHASTQEIRTIEALLRLIAYRKVWVGGWIPYWDDRSQKKYVIRYNDLQFKIYDSFVSAGLLSFPTFEMADEFRSAFKEDLRTAIGFY